MSMCLIVDDNPDIRHDVGGIMRSFHFECIEAGNGEEAYYFCRAGMPDLIILDWSMPVMSGLDFLKKLRSMTGGKDPKVLFCAGENAVDFIQYGFAAGADGYVLKPFDRDMMEHKLQQLGFIEEFA